MAERKFTVDGQTHTYDPDPPGCMDKILSMGALIAIIALIFKYCTGG